MSLTVSQRLQRVKPSPTMAVSALATELRAKGRPVIDLGAGEPDFDTPEHIKAAAIEAIRKGQTKYTQVEGTARSESSHHRQVPPRQWPRLRARPDRRLLRREADLLQRRYGGPESRATRRSSPRPYWVSYPDMIKLADGEPVIVSAGIEDGFKITPRALEAAITEKTRLIFLNSPSNPTGAAYSKLEWQALGEVLQGHPNIVIAADDIYEHIYWGDEPFVSFAAACPALYDRTVTINGVSKAYAMTGWRIGYAGGPKSIIGAMKKLQGQSTSNPCSISQAASVAALTGDQACVRADEPGLQGAARIHRRAR